ncbi:alpha/beta fold hydrolase [Streptomyces sp. NPDC001941]|uniref:alpha/beta fold hydrolase n=1 Tax=Streptomyces sp. NPDC001941 TaxID=3154659 RepID=UPI00331F684B
MDRSLARRPDDAPAPAPRRQDAPRRSPYPPPHHLLDGPPDAPLLVLGPSLGTSLRLWEPQLAALARHFRVLRYDLPGHGGSPAYPLPAGATVADLARPVLDLADGLGAGRFAYAGVSLGAAVGAHLAAHHPDRVSHLALVCTSAHFGDPAAWRARAALVRKEGLAALADAAPSRWFADPDAPPPGAAELQADHRAADPGAYAACCEALAALDLRPDLPRITARTLVVAGAGDRATPPAHARELAAAIPGARLVEVPGAGHLAGTERPGAVLTALEALLEDLR